MLTRYNTPADGTQLASIEQSCSALPLYPVDMSAFLTLSHCTLDVAGVPCHGDPVGYQPTEITHYALAHWNHYLTTGDEQSRSVFLAQAHWLAEHKVGIGEDAAGWPISSSSPDFYTRGSWLSALAQGSGISVLVQAYQLTHEEAFLEVAHSVIRTFNLDILDGGIGAPVGEDGIFFEEVALYPAAHTLNGCLFALLGLYDFITLTNDVQIEKLITRGLAALHKVLDEFDTGFWIYLDLLHRRLASPSDLNFQVMLLEALAKYSGCEHCSTLAAQWKSYQRRRYGQWRYLIANRCASLKNYLGRRIQATLSTQSQQSPLLRVCVTLPSFPETGGILTVLEGIDQVMKDEWQFEYLTQHVGSQPERFVIHRFSREKISPWHFPLVWLYVIAGLGKLLSLFHSGARYQVILPQDGIYTGAFSALAARLAGIRVVCVDHGDLSLFSSRNNRIYRTGYRDVIESKRWFWPLRATARCCLELHCLSRLLLARISARFVDHFLIPGVTGDGVEEICKDLGVPASRITRYPSAIDVEHHVIPDDFTRAAKREEKGIPANAIVIAIICRLAPEKGLDIAIESISRALAALPPELYARVRVVIAGDGPLRRQIEESIRAAKLEQACLLWGEISASEVVTLLGISDIFLYTSTRGACFAMAVLEAMASCCAVIASTEPIANASLLAGGRGVAVPPYDVEQTTNALVRLINDPELCRRMGKLARDYIAAHHNPTIFRRTLLRATYWSNLDRWLKDAAKIEVISSEKM